MISTNFSSGFTLLLVLLLSTVTPTEGGTYTSGSTSVKVSQEIIDSNNSTKKCVEYMSGAPEKWDKGCFTTKFSDGGTFINCDIQLGDNFCTSCQPCETVSFEVGYTIDCFNVEPEEDTRGLCVLLSDENIQEVLVDEKFRSQPFEWVAVDNGDGYEQQNNPDLGIEDDDSGASGMVLLNTGALVVCAAVALLGV